MEAEVDCVHRTDHSFAVTYRNVLFWCTRGTRAVDIERSIDACADLHDRVGGKICFVLTLTRGKLPDEQARSVANKGMARLNDILSGFAIVLLGDGFWASLNRSAITSITVLNRLTRVNTPMKTFARLSESVDFIRERIVDDYDDAELVRLLDATERDFLESTTAIDDAPGGPGQ